MKRFFFFIIIAIISVKAQSQHWMMTYTPAIVQCPEWRIGLQPGFGYRFNSHWETFMECALPVSQTQDSFTISNKYFRIKQELRYFLSSSNSALKGYVGIQLLYVNRSWKRNGSGSYFEGKNHNDSVMNFSSANIHSPVFAASVQSGAVLMCSNHFALDGFIGMGVRVINTRYTNVVDPLKAEYVTPKCGNPFSPPAAYTYSGIISRFQLNLGLRLMYVF
jgi:hypothetical protein